MSVETYLALITSEHHYKPKFAAYVEANVALYAHIQDLLASLITKFDIDSAVGDQLDILGKWVGASRFIRSPLTGIYFEWEDASVGWNKGIWQGEFSPSSGLTSLPDDIYRVLIKAKIAANRWDGSIPGAYEVWETLFTNNTIIIQDKQDMSMVVGIVGEPLDALTQALLTGGYILLKPEGVRISYYAIPSNDGPLFVWNGEDDNVGTAGWDVGSWADLVTPT